MIITKKEAAERGLQRYYTGEPCVRGHVAERYTSCGNCVECSLENITKWKRDNRKAHILSKARYRAKKRGVEFSVGEDDFGLPDCCPVFGVKLRYDLGRGRNDWAPSLDRVDSSRGYVPGNVVVISYRANRIKADATADELEALLSYMRGFGGD